VPGAAYDNYELEDGRWFTLYDEDHRVLLRTGIRIHVGDKFLDSDNKLYRVYKVDNQRYRAWAKFIEDMGSFVQPVQAEGIVDTDNRRIAVYHTHSGESYLPTDGVESTDQRQGGIYRVGAEFSMRLEEQTVDVTHNQDTFFPYSGSYRRSRTAVLNMLEDSPDAIFDIHRDAAPWGEYFEEVDGMQLTQILLVVGTQNPAFRVNEQFAWQLKAVSDTIYPDLVKGVFYARGDYNQDLHPRAILLEIGAHTNSRLHAETGARAFADVVFTAMYGEPNPVPGDEPTDEEVEQNPTLQSTVDPPPGRQGGLLKGVMTLLGLLGLGGGFYMFISVGSWSGVKQKLIDFKDNEFRDVISRVPWEKLRPQYIFSQFKAIKTGSGQLEGLSGRLGQWWNELVMRRRNRL
jgi:stage II sporulation protein P